MNKFVDNYNCILLFKCGKIQSTKQMPLQKTNIKINVVSAVSFVISTIFVDY